MSDGEEPVVEPTLESLQADVKAHSTLLRKLATALAQLTARDRVLGVDAGVDVGVVAVVGVAAKVSTSDGVGHLLSELLALCEATFW
eukprot:jgi/Tetstr1/455979/TSEL_042758.t1